MAGNPPPTRTETIILGGGCFWCIEAVFRKIPGVLEVESGYAGGHVEHPDYYRVCGGDTGHAEVVRVAFDPAQISLEDILGIFWKAHDPTTPNRQGADSGTQYRSVIYTTDPAQEAVVRASLEAAAAQFKDPVVTETGPLKAFYPAEASHQDYFENNRHAPYCLFVIAPKLRKLGME